MLRDVASQPIHTDGLESMQLFEDVVGVGMPLDHPLAGRTSVSIDELADQPFVTSRSGHWGRRLLDRLFAARGLTPRIVCESDEHSAIADLISAGLGIGLVPGFARRSVTRAPIAWIAVDSADCRRTVTLYWGSDSHLSPAARLMRTTITNWDWTTGDPQEKH
ncbi:LysR family transcriptional regulator substrate-binding protein [Kribbella sp. NPDC023972]|uniref:LysR family transcriptional regulator substrate-binding protein n=1 Tax=Kribbella sp. NPDC023972 TaxID=3154795 RepID=UPI0033D444EC